MANQGPKGDPAALAQEANALADAAIEQSRAVRRTAQEFLAASEAASGHPSEIVGGAIGAAVGVAAGILIIGLTTLTALAIPAIGVTGMGLGLLVARGHRGIVLDRERRNQAIAGEASLDPARRLRGEIAAAQASGAPTHIIGALWKLYENEVAASLPTPQQAQLTAPKSPLALPPSTTGVEIKE
jgi:hypothetical protein